MKLKEKTWVKKKKKKKKKKKNTSRFKLIFLTIKIDDYLKKQSL